MPLFGQDTTFYDLLEQQAEAAVQAANQLAKIAGSPPNARVTLVEELGKSEAKADELVHTLATRADEKMMTPLDKDDMQTLSIALDDLTDRAKAIGARFVLFRIGSVSVRSDYPPLLENVCTAMIAMRDAVSGLRHLRDHKKMQAQIVRIHEIENTCDGEYRAALQTLFAEEGIDPLTVIKWKDIYDRTEALTDRAEDVAELLEGLVTKYA